MKIGLIGFGNLGKSLILGLVKSGFHQEDMGVTAKTRRTMESVNELYPQIQVFPEKSNLIDFSDIIILCVEPQNAAELCHEIQKEQFKDKILISFMSGIRITDLINYLDGSVDRTQLMRVMPNIAISNCNGIIGLAYDDVPDCQQSGQTQEIITLFEKLGRVIQVKEDELEAITVSAACGLAFASTMLKSYKDAIQPLLGDANLSIEVTLQLFEGVISLIRDRGVSFGQLNAIVATKGGSTEAGLHNFDTDSMDRVLQVAVEAAYNHTKNIKKISTDK